MNRKTLIHLVSNLGALAFILICPGHYAYGKESNLIFVSNEKSSEITVINMNHEIIKTFSTCRRPRGMHFSADRTKFFVGCADDSQISIYDVKTQKLLDRIRNVAQPETFDLHPNGRHLYVSNEEDAAATVFDVKTKRLLGQFETGEEPEGVQVTSDGKLVFVASEATDLVHVIDVESQKVVADIPTDTRPRRFALTPDETELWVSAELSGMMNIIDVKKLRVVADVTFRPTGFRLEQITPVDVLITKDGRLAYVALGRANNVAVVDVSTRKILEYILVGKRAWGLALTKNEDRLYVANGLSDDITVIDTRTRKAIVSIPVGRVPYGILIDDN